LLLLLGAGLAYAALFRRWAYYAGMPLDLSKLSAEDRAALTVYWWDANLSCCGPFPAIWPAVTLLTALPLFVAGIRRRVPARRWHTFSLLSVLFGAGTVAVSALYILERGWASDSGWVYGLDFGTMAISLGGYALLFAGALALRHATGMTMALGGGT
jgi:hypothetical protein